LNFAEHKWHTNFDSVVCTCMWRVKSFCPLTFVSQILHWKQPSLSPIAILFFAFNISKIKNQLDTSIFYIFIKKVDLSKLINRKKTLQDWCPKWKINIILLFLNIFWNSPRFKWLIVQNAKNNVFLIDVFCRFFNPVPKIVR
jgi:hypothetical protein